MGDEIQEFPPALRELHDALRTLVVESRLCGDCPASVAVFNYYGERSNGMGWHVDADTNPPNVSPEAAQKSAVVSLSVGAACDFYYRNQRSDGSQQVLRLNSGDVLVFGGPSRSVEHCVNGVYSAAMP